MTASQRAAEINARYPDDGFKLVEDEAHWAAYGIRTGDELDHYLAVECYVNLYKDANGIKPRWMDFSRMMTDEVEALIEADFPSPAPPTVEPAPTQLTYSPFAGLRIKP